MSPISPLHVVVASLWQTLDMLRLGRGMGGGAKSSCMIVSDLSLRCFGGGSSEAIEHIAPTGSVVDGFGNFGQIGSGDNKTLGDEVSSSSVAQTSFSRVFFVSRWYVKQHFQTRPQKGVKR